MKLLFVGLFLFFSVPCSAESTQKVRVLAEQLRCPTCEAQSVADSNAPVAKTLRAEIAQKLAQNKTEKEILSELAVTHGEQILLSPPLMPQTYLLWFLPFLGLGLIILGWMRTQKQK